MLTKEKNYYQKRCEQQTKNLKEENDQTQQTIQG